MCQDVLSFDILKRDVRSIRESFRAIARTIETCIRDVVQDPVFQLITQPFDSFVSVVFLREQTRSAEPDDVRNGQRSSTTPLLLSAADYQRRKGNFVSHVERANALRRVQLVTGERKQIDFGVLQIYRHLTDRLHPIDVKSCV